MAEARMATDDRHGSDAGTPFKEGPNGRIDDAARGIVRDMAESSPPKSLDTIKASAAASEAAMQDHVRRRAYDIWASEGRPPGNGVDYWVRAEREVLEEAHP